MATKQPKLSDKDKEEYRILRIGEVNINIQGCSMKIIDYNNAMDITIQFQDNFGEIKKTRYERFKNGRVLNSNIVNPKRTVKIGKECLNNQGYYMKIIGEYFCNPSKVKIEFQDKFKGIVIGEYSNFIKGAIGNPNHRLYKIGEESYTNEKCIAKIVDVSNDKRDEYIIEFQDKYKARKSVQYDTFLRGNIKNPYFKSIINIGMVGETITTDEFNIPKYSYKVWKHMIERCYDKKCLSKYKAYEDCFVCDEWLIYENFEKWFDKNYYKVEGEITQIDKDILIKFNKEYSPNTCIFVPQTINITFKNYNDDYIIHNDLYLVIVKSKIVDFEFKKYYKQKSEAIFNKKKERIRLQELVLEFYKGKIPKNIYDKIKLSLYHRKEALYNGESE